nr:4-hydroxybenzoate 3-monooxygenase [Pseudonocardia acaciae]
MERTQVAIIGAGPAGLLLAHLLAADGIDAVVLEARSRAYVEQRVRAGVCEHPTVELLRSLGLADRLDREGLPHEGLSLRFDRADHRIDLHALTGKTITVYGQQELVKDLIAARLATGAGIEFEAADVALHDLATDSPRVTWTDVDGGRHELRCDAVAGCDGFHGVSRPSIPSDAITLHNHDYPFAWLGVLAKTPPSSHELIYARHARGFALHSMRSPEVTRLYLQVPPDETLDGWSDARIWDELATRLEVDGPFTLREGPVLEKGISPMRGFVAEPMRYGRLFLAGDAAHIVPPTGAKGMNLAMADVYRLAPALVALLRQGRAELADGYSERCLRRVWRAEHFSYFMTTMLHRAPDVDPFLDQLQLSQLRYVTGSTAAATGLAENYVGLPLD